MAGQPMTPQEAQAKFPIGSVVSVQNGSRRSIMYAGAIVRKHRIWERYKADYERLPFDRPYVEVVRKDKTICQHWADYLILEKPLSPLEQSISDYIAAEKRELGI